MGIQADPAFEAHAGVALVWSLAIFEHWVDIEDAHLSHCQHSQEVSGQDDVDQSFWARCSHHRDTQAYWMDCS